MDELLVVIGAVVLAAVVLVSVVADMSIGIVVQMFGPVLIGVGGVGVVVVVVIVVDLSGRRGACCSSCWSSHRFPKLSYVQLLKLKEWAVPVGVSDEGDAVHIDADTVGVTHLPQLAPAVLRPGRLSRSRAEHSEQMTPTAGA